MITLVAILGAKLIGYDLKQDFFVIALTFAPLDFFLYLVIILALLW